MGSPPGGSTGGETVADTRAALAYDSRVTLPAPTVPDDALALVLGAGDCRCTPFTTRHAPRERLALHRHTEPYVALVLEGGFDECSVDGRWRCEPGDLVVHPAWHLHADAFGSRASRVLGLRLPALAARGLGARCGVWRVRGEPALLRARRPDAAALAATLAAAEPLAPSPPGATAGALLAALADGETRRVGVAAARAGRSREHASRAFHAALGLPPRAFLAERRLRRALALLAGPDLLADVALAAGYADQAHLTRALRAATGRTPGALRRAARAGCVTFVRS